MKLRGHVTDDRDRSMSREDIKLDIITKLPRVCTNDSFTAPRGPYHDIPSWCYVITVARWLTIETEPRKYLTDPAYFESLSKN